MTDIYLIDDDVLVNFLNRAMIQEMAHPSHISTYTLATQALESLELQIQNRGKFPAWIFLDINMPYMDGWEFLVQYAKFPLLFRKDTKICLLSSSIDYRDLDCSAANPLVFNYLIKPLDENQLAGIDLTARN